MMALSSAFSRHSMPAAGPESSMPTAASELSAAAFAAGRISRRGWTRGTAARVVAGHMRGTWSSIGSCRLSTSVCEYVPGACIPSNQPGTSKCRWVGAPPEGELGLSTTMPCHVEPSVATALGGAAGGDDGMCGRCGQARSGGSEALSDSAAAGFQ